MEITEPASKKLRTEAPRTIEGKGKVIATHSGSFHCDEALAVYMLLRTTEFADASVVRTRDLKLMEVLDACVDVGATYDPGTHR